MSFNRTGELEEFYNIYKRLEDSFYSSGMPDGKDVKIEINGWNIEYITGPVVMNALNQLFIIRLNDFYTKNPSPYIIDCGANIGLSILSTKYRYPDAKILAFEADPTFYKILRNNVNNNHISGVDLVESAVWVRNGSIEWGSDSVDGSRIVDNKDHASVTANKKKTTVKTIDIADYLNKEVDLLKLDIEGAEYEVVTHLASKNAFKQVRNIIVECHLLQNDYTAFGDLIKQLKNAGFKLSVNNMGKWRDLIRRPAVGGDHYEQYMMVCGWKDDESPVPPEEPDFFPFMGVTYLGISDLHSLSKSLDACKSKNSALEFDLYRYRRMGGIFFTFVKAINVVMDKLKIR